MGGQAGRSYRGQYQVSFSLIRGVFHPPQQIMRVGVFAINQVYIRYHMWSWGGVGCRT